VVVSGGKYEFQCYSNNTIIYISATSIVIHAHASDEKCAGWGMGVMGFETFPPAHIIWVIFQLWSWVSMKGILLIWRPEGKLGETYDSRQKQNDKREDWKDYWKTGTERGNKYKIPTYNLLDWLRKINSYKSIYSKYPLRVLLSQCCDIVWRNSGFL